ncbi:hypothetical protein DFH27DRAFT_308392 [Peziza echinospora]|nr:hypothetical protein DFH27DRAFT_308392 [Peziza echinospora]
MHPDINPKIMIHGGGPPPDLAKASVTVFNDKDKVEGQVEACGYTPCVVDQADAPTMPSIATNVASPAEEEKHVEGEVDHESAPTPTVSEQPAPVQHMSASAKRVHDLFKSRLDSAARKEALDRDPDVIKSIESMKKLETKRIPTLESGIFAYLPPRENTFTPSELEMNKGGLHFGTVKVGVERSLEFATKADLADEYVNEKSLMPEHFERVPFVTAMNILNGEEVPELFHDDAIKLLIKKYARKGLTSNGESEQDELLRQGFIAGVRDWHSRMDFEDSLWMKYTEEQWAITLKRHVSEGYTETPFTEPELQVAVERIAAQPPSTNGGKKSTPKPTVPAAAGAEPAAAAAKEEEEDKGPIFSTHPNRKKRIAENMERIKANVDKCLINYYTRQAFKRKLAREKMEAIVSIEEAEEALTRACIRKGSAEENIRLQEKEVIQRIEESSLEPEVLFRDTLAKVEVVAPAEHEFLCSAPNSPVLGAVNGAKHLPRSRKNSNESVGESVKSLRISKTREVGGGIGSSSKMPLDAV